jgi:AsmA protein
LRLIPLARCPQFLLLDAINMMLMKKTTIGLSLVLGVPLIAVVAVVVFVLTLDPNRLKPIIQDAAEKQGIALDLAGDLSWRFFPNVGLEIANVEVRNASTQHTLAKLGTAAMSVAFKPLLSRKIEVNGIDVDGVVVNYWLDDKGVSNWPTPAQASATPSPPVATDQQVPTLNISALNLTQLVVSYRDAAGVATEISGLNLHAQGFNLQGYGFKTQIKGKLKYADYPLVSLNATGDMSLDLAAERAVIESLAAALVVDGSNTAISQANAKLNAQLNADLNWADGLDVKAMVGVDTLDLRSLLGQLGVMLPATQSPEVLKVLSLEAQVVMTDNSVALKDTVVKFDKSTMTAELMLKQFDKPEINANLSLDKIIVDAYLPPPPKVEETAKPVAKEPPAPLPLELIRSLNITAAIDIGDLEISGVMANAVNATVVARDGIVKLKPFGLMLAGGQVGAEVSFDARKASALLSGQVTTSGVMLDSLLEQMAQEPMLAGALNSQVSFNSNGGTDQALADNLQAEIKADSAHIKLTTINIEKRFCEAVALLKGKVASENDWPVYSELAPLQLKARYGNGKVNLESLNAEIQKLQAQSTGEIDLKTGDFRFPLDVRLAEFATSLEGCVIVDEKWRKRSVPLRCKGNLANIGAKTCLPDGPRITEKLKNQANMNSKHHPHNRNPQWIIVTNILGFMCFCPS